MFPEGRILDFVIVGVIALIVVGPKDLPLLMRRVGQFVARMRAMAAEFRASFDEMARQSELDELRREVEAMRAGKPYQAAAGLGEDGEVSQVIDDIHASLRSSEIQVLSPMNFQSPSTDAPPAEAAPAADNTPPAETPEVPHAPEPNTTIAKAAS
jgi:sec-independent protein translocase protein TatB